MAIVQADNFSIYGTTASLMLNGIYAQNDFVTLATDPDGVSGGKVLYLHSSGAGASATNGLRFVLPSNQPKCGIAQRIWLPALPTGSTPVPILFQFRDSGNTPMVTVMVNTTGRIDIRTGDHAGSIAFTTVNPVVTATGWYHVECLVNNTTNGVELRVETVEVANTTVVMASDVSQVFVGSRSGPTSSAFPWYCKDYVVYDGTGSYNNTFLGTVLVHNLATTADVSLNWTPSSGTTGWSILDNIPPVDATFISAPYNAGGPPFYPNPYVGSLSDLPVETTSVKAIMTYVRAAKSDGGDGTLQVGIISDPAGTPTTVLGTDRAITVAQTYWRDVFETDPETSAPWLPAAVNLAQLQINRTT